MKRTIQWLCAFLWLAMAVSCSKSNPTTTTPTNPLQAVQLQMVTASSNSIGLAWTKSNADGFSRYQLYRGAAPGITPGTATMLKSFGDANAISFADTTLSPGHSYYYAVYVSDNTSSIKSNEVAAATQALPGLAIGLDPAIAAVTTTGEYKADLWVANVESLFGATISILCDHAKIVVDSTRQRDFLGADIVYFAHLSQDSIEIAVTRTAPQAGVSGSGTLATIYYHAVASGNDSLTVTTVWLAKSDNSAVNNLAGIVKRNAKIIIQ